MRKPKLLSTGPVLLADIHIENRLREVNETSVLSLMHSIEQIGLQAEIHLRQKQVRVVDKAGNMTKETRLYLLAGGHRLDAMHRLGYEEIPAKVWDCTDDYARLIEIDDNLARADLEPLDMALFLAERKAVYEEMYPETKQGKAGAAARWDATDNSSVASFARATAEKLSMSERNVFRLLAAGQSLDEHTVDLLRKAPRRPSLADLQLIGKSDPEKRKTIVSALSLGTAKSASEALRADKAPGASAKNPSKEVLSKLNDAFARASKAIRREFVALHRDDLLALLAEPAAEEVATFASRREGTS